VIPEGEIPSLVGKQLFEIVARGSRKEAVRFVHSLLTTAAEPVALIQDGLVPVLRRVGELWELALIDPVEAHAMTSIVEELLSAIALHLPHGTARQQVIVACPEGEWHALPARISSELLQTHDWSVTFAGASTPSPTLGALVRSQQPLAAVLSCTTAARLVAARDAIEVLHEHHVPVLVGGPGFGNDERRARAVGADGWARSVTGADRILASWSRRAPTIKSAPAAPAPQLSPEDAAQAADVVLRRLEDYGCRDESSGGRSIGVTGPDVSAMLDLVNAGLLTADPSVLVDMLGWYRRMFAVRGYPAGILEIILDALREALPPVARSFITYAVETSGDRPDGGRAIL
jgi:methanogenic corrinoid protein MtbC1